MNPLVALYTTFIVVDTAHILSPMVLTWVDAKLREEAIARWREFILVPTLVLGSAIAVGVITSLGWTDYTPGLHKAFYIGYQWRLDEAFWPRLMHAVWDAVKIPLPLLMLVYMFWQIWHFGSQNFGVVAICLRRRMRHRQLVRAACVVGTGIFILPTIVLLFRVPQGYFPGHEIVFENQWLIVPVGLALVFVPHWLVALWLTHRASRWWFWLLIVLPLGAIGLLWQVPQITVAGPRHTTTTIVGMYMPNVPWILAFGVAVSMWHYLTDAKMWKRNSTAMQRAFQRG